MDNVDTLIGGYFAPALHQDQLEHLHMATKPFQMTCEHLGSRLHVISVGARFKGDCQSRGIQDSGFVNKYPGSSELDADVKDP